MSLAEVERFSKDLKANPKLLLDVRKNRLEAAIALAGSRGYKFDLEDAKSFIKAKSKAKGRELSDAQLDKVAGGWGSCMESIDCCL